MFFRYELNRFVQEWTKFEACFELGPFLEEAVKFVPEEHRDKPLLNERFEWLD